MKTNFLRSFFAWGGMVALTFNAFLPGFVAYAENVDGDGEPAATEDILAPTTDPEEPTTDLEEPTTDLEEPTTDLEEPTTDPEAPVIDLDKNDNLEVLETENGCNKDVCIGTTGFDKLQYAIDSVTLNEMTTIELKGDAGDVSDEIILQNGKKIKLNLNGNILTYDKFRVRGFLDVENGILSGQYGMYVYGTGGILDAGDYSYLKINSNVVVNGSYPIMFFPNDNTIGKGYGAKIDVHGRLNGNIFVSGNSKEGNSVINFKGIIDSPGIGIAQNGYSIVNIYTGASISAGETALEIRAGETHVYGGSLISTGDPVSVTSNGNGTTTVGAAVAISQHTTHLPIDVTIEGGTFEGINALLITNPEKNSISQEGHKVVVTVKGGVYSGDVVSENQADGDNDEIKNFIQGGSFSDTIPAEYQATNATIEVVDAEAKIGNVEYKTFKDARNAVKDGETIVIQKDFDGLYYGNQGKSFTVDLNGHTISISFQVKSGAVYLTGNGIINNKIDRLFEIYGSDGTTSSSASIGKDVVVNGDYGVLIFGLGYPDATSYTLAKNVTVDIDGQIYTKGFGISVNGIIRSNSNYPIINIGKDAKIISSESQGIYQAGYSKITIADGAEMEGKTTAIESRAGELVINGGTYTSKAESFSIEGNNNGTTTQGVALAISQHTTEQPISVIINGGDFKGKKAVYEEDIQADPSDNISIDLKDGSYLGEIYSENVTGFVSGGRFSVSPDSRYIIEDKAIVNVADDTVTPYHIGEKVTVTFNANGGTVNPTTKDIVKGDKVVKPSNPTHSNSCYQFNNWTKDGSEFNFDTVINSDITLTANWNYTCSRSSGGGGGGSNTQTAPATGNNLQEVVLGGEVEVNTGDTNLGGDNVLNNGNNGNGNNSDYDPELVAAYEWAYKNGITTMDTIEKARLKDGITRAELAKMMVVFMSGVLQKEPVITGNAGYKDVSEKGQGDLAGYIELAYQYQIMGINADGKALQNFNPNGKVSRAEFATVLSRVLYGSKYNQSGANYYELHIQALSEAKILKDTNPKIQELRGWIILMLYRSQNGESNNNSEENTNEVNVNTGDVAESTGTVAKTTTGSVAEQLTGAVVDLTGAVAELTGVNAELTGTVAELIGANAELTGSNAELTGSVQEAGN